MGHEIKLRNMSIYCEANPSAALGHDLNETGSIKAKLGIGIEDRSS